jgi:hypothetical protein
VDREKVIWIWIFCTENRGKYRFPGRENCVKVRKRGVTGNLVLSPPTQLTAPIFLYKLHALSSFLERFKVKYPHF